MITRDSLSPKREVMPSRNSSKSTSRPRPSRSAIMLKIVGFLLSNPRLLMADFSSLGSIFPVASVSKRLKASLSSSISSSVSPGRQILFFMGPLTPGLALVAIDESQQIIISKQTIKMISFRQLSSNRLTTVIKDIHLIIVIILSYLFINQLYSMLSHSSVYMKACLLNKEQKTSNRHHKRSRQFNRLLSFASILNVTRFHLFLQSIETMHLSNNRPNPFNDYQYLSSPRQNPPQTTKTPVDSYYFPSQQGKSKKEYGMFSRRYLPKDNSTVNRSRVSQNTTYNFGAFGEEKLYTEEMLYLLSEEENNLKYFKEKMQTEKQRVVRDFDNLKKQIDHLLQDLQISLIAQLDQVYKEFMSRYKNFKQHMVNLKEIRRNLMNDLPGPQNDYLAQLNQSKVNTISNRDLLSQIQKDAHIFRTQKIYSQIADLQKENIQPARELAAEIIVLGGIDTQYYNQTSASDMMRNITEVFNRQLKAVYPQIRDGLIHTAESIINEQLRSQNTVLNGLSQYENPNPVYQQQKNNFRSADHKDIIRSFNTNSSIKKNELKPMQDIDRNQSRKYTRPVSSSSDLQAIGLSKASKNNREQDNKANDWKKNRNYHMGGIKGQGNNPFKVGAEQQNVFAEWIEDISLRQVAVVEAYQNSEAMLCGVFSCEGKVLAVGGKDKVLRIYEVATGKMLYVLSGHQANICSLVSLGQYVGSGGDHGCSTLIIWDSKNWSIRSKMQLHTAAVTCIVDLQDSSNLATASYDKKINIFNYRKGSVVLTVSGKAGVACMGLTSDRHRLIAAALDNSIVIWRLSRQGTGVANLQMQRQFMNDSLICSLRPFALKGNYFVAGTKQGKIQIINCLTGQTIRKLSVGSAPVVQIILFQRQNKSDTPIVISCCPREKSLILTKTDTGSNNLIDLRGRLNVEIGCGIGPKLIINQSGLLGIISQSPLVKQVLFYQISLL